jgi:hypothetical protein
VLAESAKRQSPDVRFHLVLSDDYPSDCDKDAEPFDSIINVTDLPIPDLQTWLFKHTVVEMCTAVKGLAFIEIARIHNAEKIFYFDPDMAIFSGLDTLSSELDQHSILLTPHQTVPESTQEAMVDNEICSLKHGVYNLGFLGVRTSTEGMRFIRWWADRLYRFCYDDIAGGLFTDQRWIDLAPAFFTDLKILREPVYNVATWNLTNRTVSGSLESGIHVNGQPLSFYHFSGFDGGAQEVMLKKYGSGSPALFELRRWYIAETNRLGQEKLGKRRCRYDTYENGERITRDQRLLFRHRQDLHQAFPNPFSSEKENYRDWYRANVQTSGDELTDSDAFTRHQLMDARRELDLIKRSRSWRLALVFSRFFNAFR